MSWNRKTLNENTKKDSHLRETYPVRIPSDHSPSNSSTNRKSIFEARVKLFAGTRRISKRSEPPYCYWMHSPEDTHHTGTPTLDANFIPIKVRDRQRVRTTYTSRVLNTVLHVQGERAVVGDQQFVTRNGGMARNLEYMKNSFRRGKRQWDGVSRLKEERKHLSEASSWSDIDDLIS